MALIKQYFELTNKYFNQYGKNTILLMQVGAFYECYGFKCDKSKTISGSQIVKFGEICDLNVVDKNATVDNKPIVMAGFKDHLIDKYIRKIQECGFTVVVYNQDEQCVNTQRSLQGIYSPGTTFISDSAIITNNICCIWIDLNVSKQNKNNIYVGCSVIDIYTGCSNIMEFNEIYFNSPTTFDCLERFISINNPNETIIIGNISIKMIGEIINYSNIKSKLIHTVNLLDMDDNCSNVQKALNCEKQTFQSKLIEQFYKPNDVASFMSNFNNYVFATQSFCYLLDFVYQHNPSLVYKLSEPNFENICGDKLILANHSLKQLNIIDTDSDYTGKYSSVLKMLNECITPMGKRQFNNILLNPITNETALQLEYDITEHLLTDKTNYINIKNILFGFKDINKLTRQIMMNKPSPKHMYQLFITIQEIEPLFNIINNDATMLDYLHNKNISFKHVLTYANEINTFLQTKFDIEQCKEIDYLSKIDNSFININVDKELDENIEQLMDAHDQLESCRAYFNSILCEFDLKQTKNKGKSKSLTEPEVIKINETAKNNFSLLATSRRCTILNELLTNKKSIELSYVSSFTKNNKQFLLELGLDKLCFDKNTASYNSICNGQINALCKNITTIKTTLINTVIKVYSKIIKQMESFQDKLDIISQFVMLIDVTYCKMNIAQKYNYCKPEIKQSNKSFVDVTNLRHCIIEQIQQTELYVANDLILGDGQTDGILLYGTNAVGKTSFIRSLGVAIVMAQAGIYVPASSFKYKPYKYIFTRILGNDNLFKGLSTFAVEMSELRTIIKLADPFSMVLGDELCSGTESISAISIFVVGIQTMCKKKCSFIFATHQHEIANYDEITSLNTVVLKHMSVIYDKSRDLLIYDRILKDGAGTNMYGLEVCKALNLPDDFLESAHKIRSKYHPIYTSTLELNTSRYNAKHIKGVCEKCGSKCSTEIHHLQHQQDANDNGTINNGNLIFNKNNAANLLAVCEKCHLEFHNSNASHKKIKTSKGTQLITI